MVKALVAPASLDPYAQVDFNDYSRAMGEDVPADTWWGVPVWQVREWITEALRVSDYRQASVWSALVRAL